MTHTLSEYFEAFLKSKNEKKLTQKEIARSGQIREATVSDVFKWLKNEQERNYADLGDSALEALPEPPASEQIKVRKCFEQHWRITNDGYLEPKEAPVKAKAAPVKTKDTAVSGHKVHRNYRAAQVGAAINKDGEAVWVINTYLPDLIFSSQSDEKDPDTLLHWIKQKKKVRLLLLRPERHGMRLRIKSLNVRGDALANHLMDALNRLLALMESHPKYLEVRLMDEIPGVSAVILESRLFYGLHLANSHTENGPYTEVTPGTPAQTYERIKEHFETLWSDNQRSATINKHLIEKYERALYGIRNDLLPEGTWDLHLHDISGMLDGIGKAPFSTSIGQPIKWHLEISKRASAIYLQATLTLPDKQERLLKASVITERISNRDYLHLRFSNFRDLSIHLTFHSRLEHPGDPLLGYFVISSGSDCCSGYAFLTPSTGAPGPVFLNLPYFRRLLSFRDGSYMSLERVLAERKKFAPKMRFAGTYRVYSYGGKKREAKGIRINWLHIDEAGIARYKNQRFGKNDELVGRATYIDPNLHIMSTYFKHGDAQRRSYMIVGVAKNEPQEGRFYGAVHLGVSWDRQMPNGKRFILEYVEGLDFDEQVPAFVHIHSPEYQAIAEPIRSLLSGRLKNLNGFLRNEGLIANLKDLEDEWAKSIRLGEVFYDSAIQHVRRLDADGATSMLFRAVNHGFSQLKKFEDEAEQISRPTLLAIQEKEEYQKIRSILGYTNGHPPAPPLLPDLDPGAFI